MGGFYLLKKNRQFGKGHKNVSKKDKKVHNKLKKIMNEKTESSAKDKGNFKKDTGGIIPFRGEVDLADDTLDIESTWGVFHPDQKKMLDWCGRLINLHWMQFLVNFRSGTRSKVQDNLLDTIRAKVIETQGENKITTGWDDYGNLYITKRTLTTENGNEFIPCVVAHVDIVTGLCTNPAYASVRLRAKNTDRPILIGEIGNTGKQEGPGFDDKCGVYYALKCLNEMDDVKVVLFKDEEGGCIGSDKALVPFFSDVSLVIQLDKAGHTIITEETNGYTVVSETFKKEIEDLLTKYDYVWDFGTCTDVGELAEKGIGICAMNIACGYDNAHFSKEELDVLDFASAMNFADAIIAKCGNIRWLHEAKCVHTGWDGSYYGGLYDNYYTDKKTIYKWNHEEWDIVKTFEFLRKQYGVHNLEFISSKVFDNEEEDFVLEAAREFMLAFRTLKEEIQQYELYMGGSWADDEEDDYAEIYGTGDDSVETESTRLVDIIGKDYKPPQNDDGGEVEKDEDENDPFHVGKA